MSKVEHICEKNHTLGQIGEWQVKLMSEGWKLSSDDGWESTKISYCPFCGIELKNIIEAEGE